MANANAKTVQPFRIIVGVDFSEIAQEALHQAFDMAILRRADNPEVHAVVVVDDGSGGLAIRRPAQAVREQMETAQALLNDQVAAVRRLKMEGQPALPVIPTEVQVRVGDPVEQLVSVALETRASLVVIGTHGRRGLRRLVLGSVAERVARAAPCPVLIVRPRDVAAMEAIPRPEPIDPNAPEQPAHETHAYRYHSVLEPDMPPNHLL
jgi:nucleotide-binding universal stress UspA family protein